MTNTNEAKSTYDLFAPRIVEHVVVELDIVNDIDTDAPERFAAKHGAFVRLLDDEGPSGWPVYEFAGDAQAIASLIADYDAQAMC